MYAHLSKREKAKKLALARKWAILWSVQEKCKKQLQASALVAQLPPLVEPVFCPAYSDLPPLNFTTSIPPTPPRETISALQAIIADLLHQQEQLEITICVLTRRLDTLLQAQQNE